MKSEIKTTTRVGGLAAPGLVNKDPKAKIRAGPKILFLWKPLINKANINGYPVHKYIPSLATFNMFKLRGLVIKNTAADKETILLFERYHEK